MFSLIITIIAIALVAALAVATIFYGGDILVSQKAKANAATLDAQTQQIFAASQAYYLDNNAWPANVAVLSVDGKYLKTSPVPPGSAYAALPPGLMSAAYADGDGAVTGALPELSPQQKAAYLASDSALMTDFRVEAADAAVLRAQLEKLDGLTDANGANLATKALQLMQREIAVQATGKPSLLDYTWPAAAAQNPRTRYLWIPAKVNKETCRAVNVQWRQSILIPDAYSATNGTVQCFGTDEVGYSYFWLSPGADPSQIVLPGQPSGGGGGADACSNIDGVQLTVPAGYETQYGTCLRVNDQPDSSGQHLGASIDLGHVVIGQVSATRTLTVTNRANIPLTYTLDFFEYTNNEPDPTSYISVTDNTCEGQVIMPGATCSLHVTGRPQHEVVSELWVGLNYDDGAPHSENAYVELYGVTGPKPTYPLVFNAGQAGGGRVYADGTVDGIHRWGELPEAQLSQDPWIAVSFCPDSAEGSAAIEQAYAAGDWVLNEAVLDGWLSFGLRDDGTWCFISSQVFGPAGVYPVQLTTTTGKFISKEVVLATPVVAQVRLDWRDDSDHRDGSGMTVSMNKEFSWTYFEGPGERVVLKSATGEIADLTALMASYGPRVVGGPTAAGGGTLLGFSLWAGASEPGYADVTALVLDAYPNMDFAEVSVTNNGVTDVAEIVGMTSNITFSAEGDPFGIWESSLPHAWERLIDYGNSFWYVKDTQQSYAVSRTCDGAGLVAYPVGPMEALAYKGFGYKGPPATATAIYLGASVEIPMVQDALSRSHGTLQPSQLQAVLNAMPDGFEESWVAIDGSVRLTSWVSVDATTRIAAFPSRVVSLAWMAANGVTVQATAPGPCGCSMPDDASLWANQHNDLSPLAHGESRLYIVPTYWTYGCWTGNAVCDDGWADTVNWTQCPAVPTDTSTIDTAGWGTWEPMMAFSPDQGCTRTGDTGHCEVSGGATGSVCPQWGFIASGGTYNGCIRRKCDHPSPLFIPGC